MCSPGGWGAHATLSAMTSQERTRSGQGDDRDPMATARALDDLVRSIDAGEVGASSSERAYLIGAAEALRRLVDSGEM